eukprot:9255101-Pyramimonas_sp.AAC.2
MQLMRSSVDLARSPPRTENRKDKDSPVKSTRLRKLGSHGKPKCIVGDEGEADPTFVKLASEHPRLLAT